MICSNMQIYSKKNSKNNNHILEEKISSFLFGDQHFLKSSRLIPIQIQENGCTVQASFFLFQ